MKIYQIRSTKPATTGQLLIIAENEEQARKLAGHKDVIVMPIHDNDENSNQVSRRMNN